MEDTVAFRLNSTRFYHGTSEELAVLIRKSGIDLSKGSPLSDFGKGFYTSTSKARALDSAMRLYGETVDVVVIRVSNKELSSLSSLYFGSANASWADFVRFHKTYGPESLLHGGAPYDLVAGPMVRRITSDRVVLVMPGEGQVSIHTDNAVRIFDAGIKP